MAIWLLSMLISFVFFSCFFFRKEYSLTTTRCKNIYSIPVDIPRIKRGNKKRAQRSTKFLCSIFTRFSIHGLDRFSHRGSAQLPYKIHRDVELTVHIRANLYKYKRQKSTIVNFLSIRSEIKTDVTSTFIHGKRKRKRLNWRKRGHKKKRIEIFG